MTQNLKDRPGTDACSTNEHRPLMAQLLDNDMPRTIRCKSEGGMKRQWISDLFNVATDTADVLVI